MAFEATHIRFAKDLADLFQVSDKTAYYAGTVYPDSRYVTNIPRAATHGEIIFSIDLSDFEKGRLTHLLYDQYVGPRYLEGTLWHEKPVTPASDAWVYMTASKLVEDLSSYQALGSNVAILQDLSSPDKAPNQEDQEKLTRYYQLLRDLYQQTPSWDDYARLFEEFHIPADIADAVIEKSKELSRDTTAVSHIENLYVPALKISENTVRTKFGK